MKSIPFTHRLSVAYRLAFLTSTLAFGSETNLVSVADPQADALLTRNLQAVGSGEALQNITSRRTTGTLERHGNKVPIIRTQKAPNRLLMETRFPRPGTLRQGFDGNVAWIQIPGQTGRRLEGKERAALADDSWLHPALHIREQYPVRHLLGTRTIEGRTCMVLSLAQKEAAKPELWFFDETTALVSRVERQVDGGTQGEIPVVMVFEDYRKVDGIMIPFTIRTKLPTSETVLHVDKIEHNLKFDDSIFHAPF